MSFILDALKKSETDRQRQSSPALFEVKVAAPRRRLPVWAIALAALLAVNVAVLAWVLLRNPSASPAQPPAAASTATPTATQAADPSRMVTVTMPADSSSTVTLSPNHAGLHWHLAQIYAALGRKAEAKAQAAAALADPGFADRAAAQALIAKMG